MVRGDDDFHLFIDELFDHHFKEIRRFIGVCSKFDLIDTNECYFFTKEFAKLTHPPCKGGDVIFNILRIIQNGKYLFERANTRMFRINAHRKEVFTQNRCRQNGFKQHCFTTGIYTGDHQDLLTKINRNRFGIGKGWMRKVFEFNGIALGRQHKLHIFFSGVRDSSIVRIKAVKLFVHKPQKFELFGKHRRDLLRVLVHQLFFAVDQFTLTTRQLCKRFGYDIEKTAATAPDDIAF